MPDNVWTVVLLAGLYGWIISTLLFIFRSFPGRGVFERRPALCWGGCAVLFFALWVTGLLKA